jgi:hypothetical protein
MNEPRLTDEETVMNSNSHFEIARNFRRADTSLPKPHPMRLQKITAYERELMHHQLTEDDNQRGSKRLVCDIGILVMGIVSAFMPMFIAFNTLMGN